MGDNRKLSREQIVAVAYALGYWGYVIVVAVQAWSHRSLGEWISFVFFHVGIGTFWPIAAVLWYVGYFSVR